MHFIQHIFKVISENNPDRSKLISFSKYLSDKICAAGLSGSLHTTLRPRSSSSFYFTQKHENEKFIKCFRFQYITYNLPLFDVVFNMANTTSHSKLDKAKFAPGVIQSILKIEINLRYILV